MATGTRQRQLPISCKGEQAKFDRAMGEVMIADAGSLADLKGHRFRPCARRSYAEHILADHGAGVIKIEPPAGDEKRGWEPPF